jgi:hypothetical protein
MLQGVLAKALKPSTQRGLGLELLEDRDDLRLGESGVPHCKSPS